MLWQMSTLYPFHIRGNFKVLEFYGLVDYRNTFQTDLQFPGEVALVTNPPYLTFDEV